MIKIKIIECRSCPFVEFNDIDGFYGCSLSKKITELRKDMPVSGIHELCPIRIEKSVEVELNELDV